MSISSGNSTVVHLFPRAVGRVAGPQFNSWPSWLRPLLSFIDKTRQREALRAIADNKHLLADIGVSRREALDERTVRSGNDRRRGISTDSNHVVTTMVITTHDAELIHA